MSLAAVVPSEDRSARGFLVGLLVFNAVVRIATAFLPEAAYTDGIIQLTQFREKNALYPPLYGALGVALGQLGLGPLLGGRIVSALAGAAGLIPLWILANRVAGARAALFTGLVYSVAPVSLRWSCQAMSDALFATLFWFAIERLEAVFHAGSSMFSRPADASQARRADLALASAAAFGALATLTRYQGILLLPLLAGAAFWIAVPLARRAARGFHLPWRALLATGIGYALPSLWTRIIGVEHGGQFTDRLGGTLASAAHVIAQNGEAFILLIPYFLAYPIAAFVAAGWMWGTPNSQAAPTNSEGDAGCACSPVTALRVITLVVAILVIGLQSAFSSFQERYLLPMFGLLWIWGGIGLAGFQSRCARCPRLFSAANAFALAFSFLFAGAVLLSHRGAFGDFADAGRWLAANAPADARIYSDEIYGVAGGTPLLAKKLRFFSGRDDIKYLPPSPQPNARPAERLAPGSFVVFHSSYAMPWSESSLAAHYRATRVYRAESVVTPLFPDIMERPGTAQNPTAWFWRYEPQFFWTAVWRIDGPK